MNWLETMKKRGENPVWLIEKCHSICQEINKGLKGGYVSLSYLKEKSKKIDDYISELIREQGGN